MQGSGEFLVKFNIIPFTLRSSPWGGTHRGPHQHPGLSMAKQGSPQMPGAHALPARAMSSGLWPSPTHTRRGKQQHRNSSAHQKQLQLCFIARRQEWEAPGVPRDMGLLSQHEPRWALCMAGGGGGDQRGPSSHLAPLPQVFALQQWHGEMLTFQGQPNSTVPVGGCSAVGFSFLRFGFGQGLLGRSSVETPRTYGESCLPTLAKATSAATGEGYPSFHAARAKPVSICSYWEKKNPPFHLFHPKLRLFLCKPNAEKPQGLHRHHVKSTGAPIPSTNAGEAAGWISVAFAEFWRGQQGQGLWDWDIGQTVWGYLWPLAARL